jgi:hypothetical protein
MAAISWVYAIDVIGITPTGDYLAECHATISDPALTPPNIGQGMMSVVATLPGDTPASWATAVENAVIAAAAALSPPVTLTAARTILPTFG